MKKHWKWIRPLIFILLGMVAGLLYYKFFGCKRGCMLTSNPYITMLYTGLIGYILSYIFKKENKEERGDEECSI